MLYWQQGTKRKQTHSSSNTECKPGTRTSQVHETGGTYKLPPIPEVTIGFLPWFA